MAAAYKRRSDGIRGAVWIDPGNGEYAFSFPVVGWDGVNEQWVPLLVNPDGTLPMDGPSGGGTSPWSNFGQSTPMTIPVTGESTVLLEANPLRLYASFTNNDVSTVYIEYSPDDAIYRVGYPLPPNATLTITLNELYTGQVSAIANGGLTANIRVIEGIM